MQNELSPVLIKDTVEKIGNSIIYLSEHVFDLNRSKILQTLFLLEEASWKKQGRPFFHLDFQLWKMGPVVKDIYIDLSEDQPLLLALFIKRSATIPALFIANDTFNDDQFSENDLYILNAVAKFVKHKGAESLIKINTAPHSLWRQTALQYGVLHHLQKGLINSTEIKTDFIFLFAPGSVPYNLHHAIKEDIHMIRLLKR